MTNGQSARQRAKQRQIAVRIEHATRAFDHGVTLQEGREDILGRVVARALGFRVSVASRDQVFANTTAGLELDDVSLDIEEGSVVGLAGASGAGKSVLLAAIAGAAPLTSGRIEIRGTIGKLLNLRGNYAETFTMRENVEAYCRAARLDRSTIEDIYRAIVDFAELGDFEDLQLRQFSTGMAMRFNVGLALKSSPDILLLDDVLEVGDLSFQRKCLDTLLQLRETGMTVVLAMNDERVLSSVADRIVRLSQGKIVADQPTDHAVPPSLDDAESDRFSVQMASTLPENDFLRVDAVQPERVETEDGPALRLTFAVTVKTSQSLRPFIDVRAGRVSIFRTLFPHETEFPGRTVAEYALDLPLTLLAPGTFEADLGFLSTIGVQLHTLKTKGLLTIAVAPPSVLAEETPPFGLVHPDLSWDVKRGARPAHV